MTPTHTCMGSTAQTLGIYKIKMVLKGGHEVWREKRQGS